MARTTRLLQWLLVPLLALLLNHSAAHAVPLSFDIDELGKSSGGPFNLIFTKGEVVLCEGDIKGRRDGCKDGVAISDIITFTAVMQQGSSFELKSDKEANDLDDQIGAPAAADVDAVLKPVTDNVVYLAEPPQGRCYASPSRDASKGGGRGGHNSG